MIPPFSELPEFVRHAGSRNHADNAIRLNEIHVIIPRTTGSTTLCPFDISKSGLWPLVINNGGDLRDNQARSPRV
jgi:hypothetical protein